MASAPMAASSPPSICLPQDLIRCDEAQLSSRCLPCMTWLVMVKLDLLDILKFSRLLTGLQVISLCEKQRDPPLKYVIVDTPGQIEIFTWSASGAIITEAFASGFPTMIAFIIDTPRCAHPQTFMSNMLQVGMGTWQSVRVTNLPFCEDCVLSQVAHSFVQTVLLSWC